MSLSTSSSESKAEPQQARREQAFICWVMLALVSALIVGNLDIFTGAYKSNFLHRYVAQTFGADAEWVLIGDSKTGRFSFDGLAPFQEPKGIVFSSDSVTPVYHYHLFRNLPEQAPNLRPKYVFIATGANNFNVNGLHCRRDIALYNMLNLDAVAELTLPHGAFVDFFEALFSRLFPIYGKRVFITHFNISFDPDKGVDVDEMGWDAHEHPGSGAFGIRDEMKDRRYLDIYRRSVLANFEYSQAVETALSLTVDKIREMGAEPIILLLPVTEEMIALEEELVGDKFIRPLSTLSKDKNVRLIDMRRMHQYDFEDVNHLSPQGALQVINEQLIPLMGEDFE
jgi:hypothetical protein